MAVIIADFKQKRYSPAFAEENPTSPETTPPVPAHPANPSQYPERHPDEVPDQDPNEIPQQND